MAKAAPQFAHYLPESNFRGYVAPGVVDKSGALATNATTGLIADVGQSGLDAFTGYSKAGLEKAQEGVIDEYMNRRQDSVQAQEMELGAIDIAKQGIYDKYDSPDIQTQMAGRVALEPVEAEFQKRLEKLKSAKEQGVMSASEFTDRILATTREAVNKAPGLYNELLQHSGKVLELSGINAIVKSDAALAQAQKASQDDALKNLRELCDSLGVPYNAFDPNYVQMQQDAHKIQERQGALKVLEDGVKTDKAVSDKDANDWINSGQANKAVYGKLDNFTTEASKLISQANTPQMYAAAISQIKLMASNYTNTMQGATARFSDNPRVKPMLDNYNKQLEFITSTLDGLKSGEAASKFLTNQATNLKSDQYIEASETTGNPILLAQYTALLATPAIALAVSQDPSAGKDIADNYKFFSRQIKGAIDYQKKTQGGRTTAREVLAGTFKLAANGDPDSVKTLNNSVNVVTSDLDNTELFKTPLSRFNFQTEVVTEMSKPENKDGLSKLDDVGRGNARHTIDDYAKVTTEAMFNQAQKDGVKIYLDTLPDGRLSLRTDNPQTTQQYNQQFVARINQSIGALANVIGTDTKTAAEKYFYPQHLDGSGTKANVVASPVISPPVVEGKPKPQQPDVRATYAQYNQPDHQENVNQIEKELRRSGLNKTQRDSLEEELSNEKAYLSTSSFVPDRRTETRAPKGNRSMQQRIIDFLPKASDFGLPMR